MLLIACMMNLIHSGVCLVAVALPLAGPPGSGDEKVDEAALRKAGWVITHLSPTSPEVVEVEFDGLGVGEVLDDAPFQLIRQWKGLRVLTLRGVVLSRESVAALGDLTELRVLELDGVWVRTKDFKLSTTQLPSLPKCTKLRKLNLSGCLLDKDFTAYIQKMDLVSLNL